ncbi:MAG: amidohydrolase family protein, partial [Longimicrobiales bacterium]
RPVELLAECGVLDARATVVHATHLSAREVSLLCGDATVCACPTTERDLGDGFLDTGALHGSGARIAIGTDSQTMIDPLEEVRLLEYHERMRGLRRVILAEAVAGGRVEVGPVLLDMASAAGARAIGVDAGALEPGGYADFIAIDLEHGALAGWTAETLASLITLCAPTDVVADAWVGGVQRLESRRHTLDDDAAAAFRAVAARLG